MTHIPHPDVTELVQLLERANPVDAGELPDSHSAEAAALLARLSPLVDRARGERRRRRTPRLLAVGIAIVLLLVGGAAVASIAGGPWWESAPAPVNPEVVDRQLTPPKDVEFPPTADRSRARTVARADGAALVAAPVGESGYCLIPSLPGSPDLGFSCSYQESDEFRSYARPATQGTPRWIIYGRITDPRASALDLSVAAGVSFVVRLQPGGFFLANVPDRLWQELEDTAGQAKIVDASGRALRSGCVSWGVSPRHPAAERTRFSFWNDASGPCRPQPIIARPTPDLTRAEQLVELTLQGKHSIWEPRTKVALWRAPTLEGGECIFLAEATLSPERIAEAKSGHGMPGGGTCSSSPRPPAPPTTQPFTTGFSWSRHDGKYSVLLQGEVAPAVRIERITLRSSGGETEIAFDNGHYLAQFPNSSSADSLPPGGPYTLVGYDEAGHEVAAQDLQQLMQRHAPPGG